MLKKMIEQDCYAVLLNSMFNPNWAEYNSMFLLIRGVIETSRHKNRTDRMENWTHIWKSKLQQQSRRYKDIIVLWFECIFMTNKATSVVPISFLLAPKCIFVELEAKN